jgi:DNA-binding MarR family transcriptional regulator
MLAMNPRTNIAREITTNCLMGRTRYLSRVLTGLYDDEVRPFGVQASQVTLLATVAAFAPVRRSDIGRWLHFDSSTLTRNLKVMLANEWIVEVADTADRRSKLLQITQAGSDLLTALGPPWKRAQAKAGRLLGEEGRAAVVDLFTRVHADVGA